MGLKRYYEQNTPYFITCVCENRRTIFDDKWACDLLQNILTYNRFTCKYQIHAFVIMPDHFHILIQATGSMNISEVFKKIKGNFSRFYNVFSGQSGSIFQKGFYDEAIRNEEQFKQTIEYIHYNPVKNGLISDIGAYPYSSYAYYEYGQTDFALLMQPLES